MIVAFSTSSLLASVALLHESGEVLASAEREAPMAASGACLSLLQYLLESKGVDLQESTLFLSDLGPGSFTGVKVGVTLAKTMALAHKTQAGGASSFDLIDSTGIVVLPSKRGEWFIREPGKEAYRSATLPEQPFSGYGLGFQNPSYPGARAFAHLVRQIATVRPEALLPNYLIEPAISIPKKPYKRQT